jgi:phosphoribosylanthranilate isomerase
VANLNYLRVKICGVTTAADVRHATGLGADAVGFNFYPYTPRYVAPENTPLLLGELPPFVEAVGLFVGQPLAQVAEAVRPFGRIRTVQWHGEGPEVGVGFPLQLIPAFAVRDTQGLLQIAHYLDRCRAARRLPEAVLVDAHVAGLYGGTGQPAPWHLLADFRPGVPLVLAGGLTPDNVAEAVRLVRPYAVDVASGVESSPGIKDVEKMRRFIGNAREAAASVLP